MAIRGRRSRCELHPVCRAALLALIATALLSATAQAGLQEMAAQFYRMGKDAMNNRDWVDCIENLEQVVEIDSEALDAYLDLAYCQSQMGQHEDAADTYDEALQLAGDDQKASILASKAFSQHHSQDLAGAEGTYREWCQLAPQDKNAFIGLASVLRGLEKTDESIVAYQQAAELDPNDAQLLKDIGELCVQNGMEEQAVVYYRRWAETEPDNVDAKRQLAYMLSKMGDCDDAGAMYDAITAADPSVAGDWLNGGVHYMRCNQPSKAEQYFAKYRDLEPNDTKIVSRLLYLREDLGQAMDGIKLAREALADHPNDPQINFAYGRLLDLRGRQLQDQKKYDDAIERFNQAMARFQKVLGHSDLGGDASKQIERAEQLIIRAQRLKQRDAEGAN